MVEHFFIIICSALLSLIAINIFNHLDENAFCDYDEIPIRKPQKDRRLTNKDRLNMFLYVCLCNFIIYFHIKSIWVLCLFAVTFATLLLISFSDKKYFIIPDEFLSILFFAGLVFALLDVLTKSGYLHKNFISPLLGLVVGGGVPYVIGYLSSALFKKDSMGFGDVKLFSIIGFFVGVKGVLAVFLISVVMAGVYCGILLILKKMTFSSMIAFGPFICGATVLYLCFFREIAQFINWYISLFT